MIMANMFRSLSAGDELTHHILEVTLSHKKSLDRKLPAKSNLNTTFEEITLFLVPPPAAVQHFTSAPPILATPASKRNFSSTVTPDIRNHNADAMTHSMATPHRLGTHDNLESGQDNLGFNDNLSSDDNLGSNQDKLSSDDENLESDKDNKDDLASDNETLDLGYSNSDDNLGSYHDNEKEDTLVTRNYL
jgi:hypothetical protein